MKLYFLAFCLFAVVGLTAAEPRDYYNQPSHEDIVALNRKTPFPNDLGLKVEYNFYLPYTDVFSSSPVKYPVHMWIDAEDDNNTKIRIDQDNGLNKEITFPHVKWVIHPRMDQVVCNRENPHPHQNYVLKTDRGLPHDMGNWTYMGKGVYDDKECDVFQLTETFFERTAFYTLYIDLKGAPLFLSAIGQNYFSGAHFDEYLAYFTNYVPGVPDPSVFYPPAECNKTWVESDYSVHGLDRPMVVQLNCLVPRVIQGHDDYDQFLSRHGRMHSSPIEYQSRLDIFLRNKRHIEQHNMRNDVTYTLELNKFADYTDDEFNAFHMGHLEETDEVRSLLKEHAVEFVDRTNDDPPLNFSWVGTGADGIVKDQAVCGSCWAFAASQAMEGAWFVATNESLSFSEQQMVDCAWDYLNHACEGGFIATAVLYAIFSGGIASEFAYPYRGMDDFCNYNSTPIAKFADVGLVKQFEPEMVKKALVEMGPLGVSMDAGHLDFRFYKSGVFIQPECKSNRTNHAVTLMGYGNENGRDYWLIKNSWSTFWGDKGYAKMDAEEFDCGITYRPVFAVADTEAAEERKEELRHLHNLKN